MLRISSLGLGIRIRHQYIRHAHRFLATASKSEDLSLDNLTDGSFNTSIRTSPFSKIQSNIRYDELPLDTYPNPLFNMSKNELMNLSRKSYVHLSKIPYRVIDEVDQFCLTIINIIENNILLDSKLVTKLLLNIQDESIKQIIIEGLKSKFSEDPYKLSTIEFILDPETNETQRFIQNCLSSLQVRKETTSYVRGELVLQYLKTLATTGVVNKRPILLSTNKYTRLIRCTPPSQFHELYSYLFHINIQTVDLNDMLRLKRTLAVRSQIESFVWRTGWMNPKLHHINSYEFSDNHMEKMVNFFTIDDLRVLCKEFIKRDDVVNASLYLNLLVSKFERKCEPTNYGKKQSGDTLLVDDIQTVLKVTLDYLMKFKDFKSCLLVLKYLLKHGLKVEFKSLLSIMSNLREQSRYDDAILIMNNIDLANLSSSELCELAHEMLLLIKSRYPKSPKVLIGYIASFCNSPEQQDKVLKDLNDLNILNIIYGDGQIGNIGSLDRIQRANVDSRLSGFNLTSDVLGDVYDCLLNSLSVSKVSPQLIHSLYTTYIDKVKTSLQSHNSKNAFVENNEFNDRVLYSFINHLLYNNSREMVNSTDNYEVAKEIFTDFTEKVNLDRKQITISQIDLLIRIALNQHHDYKFAAQVIRYSREKRIPFTFNQIHPFIMFHYSRQEFDAAKVWYNELIKSGINTNSQVVKTLWKIARELGWETTGFTYRKWQIKKNYKAKEEMDRINSDPIIFLQDKDTEERITEELIDSSLDDNDGNFSAELGTLLYQLKDKDSM
ncbi:uncharacterized protein RJT21DRAFT_117176 [Scheffersomyces amazonensis]|uniref:uncharacterized protein n=1 Tax=Scheffersomyces amazonensis TaxID=1078765 RepID=UPI00315D22EF